MTELLGVLALLVVAVILLRAAGSGGRTDDAAPVSLSMPIPPVPTPRGGPVLRPHPQQSGSRRTGSTAAPPANTAPATTTPRPRRTRLFGIGGVNGGEHRHDGPYAVIGYATTGFTPVRDRIVALAIVHIDPDGRLEGQYVTHLAPGTAPIPPHLESVADRIHQAPSFARAAPHLLTLLEGRVVVTHHPEFLESFLDAHLMEAGILAPSLPVLSTFETGRATFPTRNHRLTTLAREVRSDATPGASVLDEALATAALMPAILDRHRDRLLYPCAVAGDPAAVVLPAPGRSGGAAAGTSGPGPDPWLAEAFARASGLARELNDIRVARFVDVLVPVLLQGRIVIDEVRGLTRLMVAAGYNADELRAIQERLLESLRKAAFDLPPLTRMRLQHLRATATSVGIPTYFDDLIPPPAPEAPAPGSGSFSRPVRKPVAAPPPPHLPRCGHCLSMGHYTSQCPRRERGPVRAIDPI